ncbi:hypothetical protein FNF31_02845 [Cafeteria roenbergensis]|uniref:non-specific serine/threonine protein kinase n=1 Tax=Cafeteria roenbergensis TaxID=33653 RepID=A0A5A8DI40_CAFRO|nr:hypothetical protein FNF31_02845 [Cafeteria roenbergensis]
MPKKVKLAAMGQEAFDLATEEDAARAWRIANDKGKLALEVVLTREQREAARLKLAGAALQPATSTAASAQAAAPSASPAPSLPQGLSGPPAHGSPASAVPRRVQASAAQPAPAAPSAARRGRSGPSARRQRGFHVGKVLRTALGGDEVRLCVETHTGRMIEMRELRLPGNAGADGRFSARGQAAAANAQRMLQRVRTMRCRHIVRPLGIQIVPPPARGEPGFAAVRAFFEVASGGSLRQQVARFGAMEPPLIAQQARRLVAALAAIHRKGMAHGRVSPDSCLIDSAGRLRLDAGDMTRHNLDAELGGVGSSAVTRMATAEDDMSAVGAVVVFMASGQDLQEEVENAARRAAEDAGHMAEATGLLSSRTPRSDRGRRLTGGALWERDEDEDEDAAAAANGDGEGDASDVEPWDESDDGRDAGSRAAPRAKRGSASGARRGSGSKPSTSEGSGGGLLGIDTSFHPSPDATQRAAMMRGELWTIGEARESMSTSFTTRGPGSESDILHSVRGATPASAARQAAAEVRRDPARVALQLLPPSCPPELADFVAASLSTTPGTRLPLRAALRHAFLATDAAGASDSGGSSHCAADGTFFLPDSLEVRWRTPTVGRRSSLAYRVDPVKVAQVAARQAAREAAQRATLEGSGRLSEAEEQAVRDEVEATLGPIRVQVPQWMTNIRKAEEGSAEQLKATVTASWWEALGRRPKSCTEEDSVESGASSLTEQQIEESLRRTAPGVVASLGYDPDGVTAALGATPVLLQGCNEATVADSDDDDDAFVGSGRGSGLDAAGHRSVPSTGSDSTPIVVISAGAQSRAGGAPSVGRVGQGGRLAQAPKAPNPTPAPGLSLAWGSEMRDKVALAPPAPLALPCLTGKPVLMGEVADLAASSTSAGTSSTGIGRTGLAGLRLGGDLGIALSLPDGPPGVPGGGVAALTSRDEALLSPAFGGWRGGHRGAASGMDDDDDDLKVFGMGPSGASSSGNQWGQIVEIDKLRRQPSADVEARSISLSLNDRTGRPMASMMSRGVSAEDADPDISADGGGPDAQARASRAAFAARPYRSGGDWGSGRSFSGMLAVPTVPEGDDDEEGALSTARIGARARPESQAGPRLLQALAAQSPDSRPSSAAAAGSRGGGWRTGGRGAWMDDMPGGISDPGAVVAGGSWMGQSMDDPRIRRQRSRMVRGASVAEVAEVDASLNKAMDELDAAASGPSPRQARASRLVVRRTGDQPGEAPNPSPPPGPRPIGSRPSNAATSVRSGNDSRATDGYDDEDDDSDGLGLTVTLTVTHGWDMFDPHEEENDAFGNEAKQRDRSALKATDTDSAGRSRALRLFMATAAGTISAGSSPRHSHEEEEEDEEQGGDEDGADSAFGSSGTPSPALLPAKATAGERLLLAAFGPPGDSSLLAKSRFEYSLGPVPGSKPYDPAEAVGRVECDALCDTLGQGCPACNPDLAATAVRARATLAQVVAEFWLPRARRSLQLWDKLGYDVYGVGLGFQD